MAQAKLGISMPRLSSAPGLGDNLFLSQTFDSRNNLAHPAIGKPAYRDYVFEKPC
jgi:hypothetical protein